MKNRSARLVGLFDSSSPQFYESEWFQNEVDPIIRPSIRSYVRGLILARFGPQHSASNDFAYDDVTNEAMFKTYKGLDGERICRAKTVPGRLQVFRKFVYTIARNCARQYGKRQRTNREIVMDEPLLHVPVDDRFSDFVDTPPPAAPSRLPQLRSLLYELSDEDQRLLYLRLVAEYSWPTIEHYFDFKYSRSRLKVRTGRLLNRLRARARRLRDAS